MKAFPVDVSFKGPEGKRVTIHLQVFRENTRSKRAVIRVRDGWDSDAHQVADCTEWLKEEHWRQDRFNTRMVGTECSSNSFYWACMWYGVVRYLCSGSCDPLEDFYSQKDLEGPYDRRDEVMDPWTLVHRMIDPADPLYGARYSSAYYIQLAQEMFKKTDMRITSPW